MYNTNVADTDSACAQDGCDGGNTADLVDQIAVEFIDIRESALATDGEGVPVFLGIREEPADLLPVPRGNSLPELVQLPAISLEKDKNLIPIGQADRYAPT